MPLSMRLARRPLVLALASFAFAAATPAGAQVMNRESALEMRKQFMTDLDTLQSKMLALATAIPVDKYDWRPAVGVRSIGEAFMHVASEYYVFAPMAYGGKRSAVIPPGSDAFENFEKHSTKADVMKHLADGFAYMHDQLSSLDPAAISGTPKLFGKERTIAETSMIMTADLHEHLGQMIAYARMNGIKPPWSK